MKKQTLQQRVDEALNQAVENGWRTWIIDTPTEQIASDMIDSSTTFEHETVEGMLPCIINWLERQIL